MSNASRCCVEVCRLPFWSHRSQLPPTACTEFGGSVGVDDNSNCRPLFLHLRGLRQLALGLRRNRSSPVSEPAAESGLHVSRHLLRPVHIVDSSGFCQQGPVLPRLVAVGCLDSSKAFLAEPKQVGSGLAGL